MIPYILVIMMSQAVNFQVFYSKADCEAAKAILIKGPIGKRATYSVPSMQMDCIPMGKP